MLSLKDFVLKEVKPEDYYENIFPNWTHLRPTNIKCIWHDDSTASLAINLRNGGAHCHGCGKSIGNIIHFESDRTSKKLEDDTAAAEIFSRHIRPVIAKTKDKVDRLLTPLQLALKSNETILFALKSDLGISDKIIDEFRIGFKVLSGQPRLTLPVINTWGLLTNVRYYLLPSLRSKGSFKLLNEKGFGSPPTLFGATEGGWQDLWLMSGERDVLSASEKGFRSVCLTNGEAAKFPQHELKNLKLLAKRIVLIPDNDEQGEKNVARRSQEFVDAQIPFAIARVPEAYKDFSEWLQDEPKETDEIPLTLNWETPKSKKIARQSDLNLTVSPPSLSPSGQPRVENEDIESTAPDDKLPVVDFPGVFDPESLPVWTDADSIGNISLISRRPELLNRVLELSGVVSGKLDRSYSIPRSFRIGDAIYRLPISRELISLVHSSDSDIEAFVRSHLSPAKKAKISITERVNVSQVEIIPVIVPGQDSVYVTQKCYFIGERIETNVPYSMRLIPTTEVRSQETVAIITQIKPIANVLDEFKFSKETHQRLDERFTCPSNQEFAGLQTLADEVADRYTNIHSRQDWHIVALLSWICPLQFNFPNEGLQRGWMNTLALGDTETGKSRVAQSLRNLFNCGEFISAENCTYVGLVGGAVKSSSGMFMLRWGKIPLYNRQLVVIEELSGLSVESISHMSEVRSSGIARLDKGGLSAQTSSRTRLICLSNVRGEGRSLSQSTSGIRELQQLIGHGEDIARFDLIITLADSEVSSEVINANRFGDLSDHKYSEEERQDFQDLARFAWSIKPDQIEITKEAYEEILKQTLEIAKIYHPGAPLFKSGSGRFKLARISVAIATLQYSINKEGKLQVLAGHVKAAVQLLETLFKKSSLGYYDWSKEQFHQANIKYEDTIANEIKVAIPDDDIRERVYRFLMNTESFDTYDLTTAGEISGIRADSICGKLLGSNLIKKNTAGVGRSNKWQITPVGKDWLGQRIKETTFEI